MRWMELGYKAPSEMEPSPIQKGSLFVSSFPLHLLLALSISLKIYHFDLNVRSIKIHKLKTGARLMIGGILTRTDLPFCMIFECGI